MPPELSGSGQFGFRGNLVVTSGVGGAYPRGLIIGTVEEVLQESDGISIYATIRPAADILHLTDVMIIKSFYGQGVGIPGQDDGTSTGEPSGRNPRITDENSSMPESSSAWTGHQAPSSKGGVSSRESSSRSAGILLPRALRIEARRLGRRPVPVPSRDGLFPREERPDEGETAGVNRQMDCVCPLFFAAFYLAADAGRPAGCDGGASSLLLPAVVCVALYDQELFGAVFGVIAGVLWDLNSIDRPFGYSALLLMAIGCLCGLLVSFFIEK